MTRIALALWIALATGVARAETASVIDPTEGLDSAKPSAAAPKPSAQADSALKRERAEAEQRRRAKAQARAHALEKERARLRALEQARQESAAREAAARKAAAAQAAHARASAAKAAASRLAALREAAARELAEREAAAREKVMKEEAARQLAAKEEAAKAAADRREAARREGEIKRVAAREAPMLKDLSPVGAAFRDCARCPELVWLPQGEFVMGDASAGTAPRQVVAIRHKLAVGRYEVTFSEWDACAAAGGCRRRPHDAGWGRGWQPVINVSWSDAQQYVAWLSRNTGKRYRLLTEAEWEYAARAGTDVRYWWGDQASRGDANCAECGSKWDGRQAAPVGRFAPNPFGLHDMHGNVSEWVEDCYHERCGSADARVVRGGAWYGSARSTRSTSRTSAAADHADNGIGFRVARTE